jgi:hypothetical protein
MNERGAAARSKTWLRKKVCPTVWYSSRGGRVSWGWSNFPVVVKKLIFSRQVPVHQPFRLFTEHSKATYAGHKLKNAVERAMSQLKTFIQHYDGTTCG